MNTPEKPTPGWLKRAREQPSTVPSRRHVEAVIKRAQRQGAEITVASIATAANVDRAYCRCASNGSNTKIGYWSNASDTTYSIDCTKMAVFVSGLRYSADGLKIAELEVDFTNKP